MAFRVAAAPTPSTDGRGWPEPLAQPSPAAHPAAGPGASPASSLVEEAAVAVCHWSATEPGGSKRDKASPDTGRQEGNRSHACRGTGGTEARWPRKSHGVWGGSGHPPTPGHHHRGTAVGSSRNTAPDRAHVHLSSQEGHVWDHGWIPQSTGDTKSSRPPGGNGVPY